MHLLHGARDRDLRLHLHGDQPFAASFADATAEEQLTRIEPSADVSLLAFWWCAAFDVPADELQPIDLPVGAGAGIAVGIDDSVRLAGVLFVSSSEGAPAVMPSAGIQRQRSESGL